MWKVEVSGDARADRETVWAWYEATDEAPTWDPLIKRIESTGPLELGVRGRNHPVSGPAAPFVYTEVTRLVSYTEVSSAPGAKFAFTHVVTDLQGGRLRITHGAEVSGPLASLYRPLMRTRFEKGMRVAMDNFVQRVEAGPPPAAALGRLAAEAAAGPSAPPKPSALPVAPPDAGAKPQTRVQPKTSSRAFKNAVHDIWLAVTTGDPKYALPAFFLEKAYEQVKAIAYPESD